MFDIKHEFTKIVEREHGAATAVGQSPKGPGQGVTQGGEDRCDERTSPAWWMIAASMARRNDGVNAT